MLHTLLLVCCLNQFTVTVEKPLQSFTVQVDEPKQKEYSDYYVVMFTASWCGPCKTYKESGSIEKLRNNGVKVVLVDIDKDSSYYSGRVPKFWLCKNKVRVTEFPEGAVSPDRILSLIKQLDPKKPMEHIVYNGYPNNSHTNRQSLINHLLNDGIHRGKYRLDTLNNLSDIELDKLHSLDHNTK